MRCKEAHLLIAGLCGDQTIPEELAKHLQTCGDCMRLFESDARLQLALHSIPTANPDALGRIREAMTEAPHGSWLEVLRRSPHMKFTLPVAAALVATTLFLAVPHSAQASSALSTFRKMKTAVKARAKDMTQLGFKIGRKDDGTIGTWVLLNGDLTEVLPNTTFHTNKNGADITVSASHDLSSLPPEMRAQAEKAMQEALAKATAEAMNSGSGVSTSFSATINGKPSDLAEVTKLLHDQGVDFHLDIDLDENHYQSIAFGKDPSTLVLTTKSAKDRHLVVHLDGKSNLPKSVQLEQLKNGHWSPLRQSNVTLL